MGNAPAYPEGTISVSIETGHNGFMATARIYLSCKKPGSSYLSEATAFLRLDPSKPTVSAREWAQTAAVGIALRNAGFGLQFGAAGDEFTSQLPNEFPGAVPVVLPPVDRDEPIVTAPQHEEVQKELSPKEKYQMACSMMWPNKKYDGSTLGEELLMDPAAINWGANKYMGNPEASAVVKFICDCAMNNVLEEYRNGCRMLVYANNRFARNRADSVLYRGFYDRLGIVFDSVAEICPRGKIASLQAETTPSI